MGWELSHSSPLPHKLGWHKCFNGHQHQMSPSKAPSHTLGEKEEAALALEPETPDSDALFLEDPDALSVG